MDRKQYLDIWSLYFMSVKGWQYHPGNKAPLTTADCARIADEMLDTYLSRLEDDKWPG